MKHFLCFNEIGKGIKSRHFDLARVAAITSRDVGRFDVHILYDGDDQAVIRWFRDRGIKIFRYESSLKKLILDKIPAVEDAMLSRVLRGTLLRLEIPVFLKQVLRADDRFVLYTDTDVLFLKNAVDALSGVMPKTLALRLELRDPQQSPPADPKHYQYNSGVMVMNVDNLYKGYPELMRMIGQRIREFRHNQDAINALLKPNLEMLPLIYNWTPYFGRNEEARILHFHGPKPTEDVTREGYRLKGWVSDYFFEMAELWKKVYFSFESEPPAAFERSPLPVRALEDGGMK